jgi:hypothetical protein
MCQLKVGGFRRLFATLGVLLFVPVMSIAQTAVSGSIAGTVRDTTGAVLPGVTIEASSPALIEKVRVAVTDDSGQFKLVDLRPWICARAPTASPSRSPASTSSKSKGFS